MRPSSGKPDGPPPSAGVLGKLTRAYAASLGVAEKRVRAWISYMMLGGVLERARTGGDVPGYRFTLKGGVALELRLKNKARATKDVDLVLHHGEADLVEALTEVVIADAQQPDGYQGFRFQRRREPIRLDNGTVNMELAVTYRGGAWTTISVDVARAEAGESEVDVVPAIPLEALGVNGPVALECIPLPLHVAQKLHGMTLPPRDPAKPNDRFRDLIDLILMEELVTDLTGLRAACETVFGSRGTHDWPPSLELPEHWRAPYTRLANELDLPVQDADQAMQRVRELVERIRSA